MTFGKLEKHEGITVAEAKVTFDNGAATVHQLQYLGYL